MMRLFSTGRKLITLRCVSAARFEQSYGHAPLLRELVQASKFRDAQGQAGRAGARAVACRMGELARADPRVRNVQVIELPPSPLDVLASRTDAQVRAARRAVTRPCDGNRMGTSAPSRPVLADPAPSCQILADQH